MKLLPALYSDSYKQFHAFMYPKNLTFLFSNETPRKSRLGTDYSVFFGLQYYIKEYLIKQWDEQFFERPWIEIEAELKRFHKHFSGVDFICDHWKELYELGYLPLEIRALPEGAIVPIGVPYFVVYNTHEKFAWLVNFIETQISVGTWDFCVVATISNEYRRLLSKYAMETTGSTEFVQWQGHDFSMRGRTSLETCYNQAGHLLSFTGTDTIPAVMFLEEYYNANMEKELIGASVPSTEHSVMMCRGPEGEFETFEKLIDEFPNGILSIVSDTWDLWKVCTEYLPRLKDKILSRNGKIVIRPDSGNPVDIICGRTKPVEKLHETPHDVYFNGKYYTDTGGKRDFYHTEKDLKDVKPYERGVIELLWDIFGGTINEHGYKVLDPHIGAIYGDSITLDRADEICKRLKAKGFASTNVVFGIGSYTFNYNTRDSLGIAIKATYCELDGVGKEIFKDPITDDGTKKSAKGLLSVWKDENGRYILKDQATKEDVLGCSFELVFSNSKLIKDRSLSEIRARLHNNF